MRAVVETLKGKQAAVRVQDKRRALDAPENIAKFSARLFPTMIDWRTVSFKLDHHLLSTTILYIVDFTYAILS